VKPSWWSGEVRQLTDEGYLRALVYPGLRDDARVEVRREEAPVSPRSPRPSKVPFRRA
jgi:hypothetical protein